MLAFPEGTRTLDGRVGPFRKGIFVAARDLGMKVVPTAVTGMYDVMRKGQPHHPARAYVVRVYCDAPVDFAGVSDDALPERIAEPSAAAIARARGRRHTRGRHDEVGDVSDARTDGRSTRANRKKRVASRRRQILDAARTGVCRKAAITTTHVSDVIEAAGIARGTFYLYFESKSAIFLELLEELLKRAAREHHRGGHA